MKGAGYDIRESDPFRPEQNLAALKPGDPPVIGRICALWGSLREPVLKVFPKPRGLPKDRKACLSFVDQIYKSDAYHSLSIEGCTVTPELIERVRSGNISANGSSGNDSIQDQLTRRGLSLRSPPGAPLPASTLMMPSRRAGRSTAGPAKVSTVLYRSGEPIGMKQRTPIYFVAAT